MLTSNPTHVIVYTPYFILVSTLPVLGGGGPAIEKEWVTRVTEASTGNIPFKATAPDLKTHFALHWSTLHLWIQQQQQQQKQCSSFARCLLCIPHHARSLLCPAQFNSQARFSRLCSLASPTVPFLYWTDDYIAGLLVGFQVTWSYNLDPHLITADHVSNMSLLWLSHLQNRSVGQKIPMVLPKSKVLE